MKQINFISKFLLAFSLIIMAGCASSGGSKKKINQSSSNKTLTLRDFLNKASGVYLTGSRNNTKLNMRSSTSQLQRSGSEPKQPLFIIDGQQEGRDFNRVASSLSPGEIKSVEVIQGGNSSLYGSKGFYGVIKITTTRSH